jgi:SOS-response transcriptional repressor LexA
MSKNWNLTESVNQLEAVRAYKVPDYGQLGAGEVVEFIPRGKDTIYLSKSEYRNGMAKGTVCGNSLIDMGIGNGDELLLQTKFEKFEITNGKLVVALLPIGLVVKFFYQYENKIVLRSANPRHEDLIYDADLVTIKAIVLKSIKDWS